MSDPAPPTTSDPTTGELVSHLSEQTTRLVRDEVALAKVELTEKAKHVGVGAGNFIGAGLVAQKRGGTLIATL